MSTAQLPILLIDDDARLGALVRDYLAKHEISVTVAGDGERGLRLLEQGAAGAGASKVAFSAVLLDLMLPGIDGLEVCRRIRQSPQHAALPVIMLTAKGDDVDKIVGLELGADDYLAKPFNPRELLARVRAVLRRSIRPEATGGGAGTQVRVGELVLDPERRSVTMAGQPRALTSFEFELLAVLMRAAGRVLSREHLLEALKGEEFESFDRSIDVHISKLRAKLEADPKNPRYIKTVRGVGYVCARGDEVP